MSPWPCSPRCSHSFRFLTPIIRETCLTDPARTAIAEAGLSERIDTPVANLAHGERRQLKLAMSLVGRPDVLLPDEPMAGMSHTESQRVVELLLRLKGRMAILVVDKNLKPLLALADRNFILEKGRVAWQGSSAELRADPTIQAHYLSA